jgi:hypothetical protein
LFLFGVKVADFIQVVGSDAGRANNLSSRLLFERVLGFKIFWMAEVAPQMNRGHVANRFF